MRFGLFLLVVGCDVEPAPQPAAPPPNALQCVPRDSTCSEPLPALDGAWTAQLHHTNYHGTSLGEVTLAVDIDVMAEEGCYLLTVDKPSSATTYWPDPSGAWSVGEATASHDAAGPNAATIRASLCTRNGVLVLGSQSGFSNSGHTSWESLESLGGTLTR
jgi:hypothetical protein